MSPAFSIDYDAANKSWLPAQMRVRMMACDANGQYNPCSFSNPEFICEPAGWLAFSPGEQGEIIAAQVSVTDLFINNKSADKFSQPVKVTVKGTPPPSSGSEAKPVSVECTVSIAEPGQNMGFIVSPAEFCKDGEVWLPADGRSSCILTLWVEEVDPATGQIYRAPEEDFEFKVESSFPPETLVSPDLNLGIIKPVSSWKTANPMPELRSSLPGKLFIKAYSRKNQSGNPCGKLDIPIFLFPAKITTHVTYTPPLPARPGQEITARIYFCQEATNSPLANTPVEFSWAGSCAKSPLGHLAAGKTITDDEGIVELVYSAPAELVYQAKKRYYDELVMTVGGEKSRAALDETLIIPVMPMVKFSGSAEKKGLIMDPAQEEIEVLPEQLNGGEIRGNLLLPATVAGEPRKLFGVKKARLSMIYDGHAAGSPPVLTQKSGVWVIKLPELNEAMNLAKLPITPLKLPVEPERKQVLTMLLAEPEEQTIKEYEDEVNNRLQLYSAKFQRELKLYRYQFCSQLARENEENHELAISGIKLVQIAVRGSDMFFRRFKCHENMVKTRFEGLLGSLINILLNTAQASKLLRQAGSKAASGGKAFIEYMVESRFGRWIHKGAIWLGSFASSIGDKAMKHIVPLVKNMGTAVKNFITKIGNSGGSIVKKMGALIDGLVKNVDTMAKALVDKVTVFQKALVESSQHWSELVAWVSKKKTAAGAALDNASTWIASFLEKLQGMFQAITDLVANIFTQIGKLLYSALSGILSWCTKTAQTWLAKALNWLCEHSEPVKQKVEEILKTTMTQTQFAENGIEGCIGAILNQIIGKITNSDVGEEVKTLGLQDIKMQFAVLGKQPNQVVGHVYRAATIQQLPKDWESARRKLIDKIVELNTSYHDYEEVTATIDNTTEIVGMIISLGSLGIALLSMVYSGGASMGMAVQAISFADSAFNIAKAALCDIPQVSVAMYVMVALVIKYDLIITELWLGSNSGATT